MLTQIEKKISNGKIEGKKIKMIIVANGYSNFESFIKRENY